MRRHQVRVAGVPDLLARLDVVRAGGVVGGHVPDPVVDHDARVPGGHELVAGAGRHGDGVPEPVDHLERRGVLQRRVDGGVDGGPVVDAVELPLAVGLLQQTLDGHVGERRVADPLLAVGHRQLQGLDHEVRGGGLVRVVRPEIGLGDGVERGEHRQALARGRVLVHDRVLVLEGDGLQQLGLVAGHVGGREGAATVAHGPDDPLGEVTAVDVVASGLDAGLALAGPLGCVDDALEGVGEVGLHDRVARVDRRAVRDVDLPRRVVDRVGLEGAAHLAGQLRRGRVTLTGERDRGFQQTGDVEFAVLGQQHHPALPRGRDDGLVQAEGLATPVGRALVVLAHRTDRLQAAHLRRLGVVVQRGRLPADHVGVVGLDDAQHGCRGNGGVGRGPSVVEDCRCRVGGALVDRRDRLDVVRGRLGRLRRWRDRGLGRGGVVAPHDSEGDSSDDEERDRGQQDDELGAGQRFGSTVGVGVLPWSPGSAPAAGRAIRAGRGLDTRRRRSYLAPRRYPTTDDTAGAGVSCRTHASRRWAKRGSNPRPLGCKPNALTS